LKARAILGIPKSRRKDDIKIDLKKHDIGVERIDLAQEREHGNELSGSIKRG